MEPSELKSRLSTAVAEFFNQHHILLTLDGSERSIAHKLAECLVSLFSPLDVDCEYNRHLHEGEEKRLEGIKEFVRAKRRSGALSDTEEDYGVCVSPDIIIHERTNDESNLLVIELKKTGHPLREEEYDLLKIKRYIAEIQYRYGLFLEFGVKDSSSVKKALLFSVSTVEPEDITSIFAV